MARGRWISLLLVGFAVSLFLDARPVHACSCGGKLTVLDAYERAPVVVLARAVAIEKTEDGKGVNRIRSTKFVVEKSYKGKLKEGDDLVLRQGGGADCIWTFGEEDIDEQYLFYLFSLGQNPKVWVASTCGRSKNIRYATDDLLYLNNMEKLRGKTRISGTISFDKPTDLSVEGRTIRITGAGKTYEVKTDANGVYEVYGLPPGKYFIEPEIPLGWKVDRFWLRYSAIELATEDSAPKRIPVTLADEKHAGLDIHFEIDNFIRGKVLDLSGKPMLGVCVKAYLAEKGKDGGYLADCTNADGDFEITELPRASYILVVNDDGKISSSEPFKTFYYPNVLEREKATVITIGEGDRLEGINITPPVMEETITVEGLFLYADGKPVVDEGVQFKAEKAKSNVEADAYAKTDAKGRFSIKILKGLKGKLFGGMYTYLGEFKNCPKLDRIIKKTGQDFADLETPALWIQAENNLYNVELKFPFPGCEKADDN